jgi:hypothetical protein
MAADLSRRACARRTPRKPISEPADARRGGMVRRPPSAIALTPANAQRALCKWVIPIGRFKPIWI